MDGHIYCDGDAGVDVPNHDMVVATHAFYLIMEAVALHGTPEIKWLMSHAEDTDGEVLDVDELREALHNAADDMHQSGQITDEQVDDIYSWISETCQFERVLWDLSLNFNSKWDHSNRSYAIRQWNWIRVTQDLLTLRSADRETCERLYSELGEICDNEGVDIDSRLWQVELVIPSVYGLGVPGVVLGTPRSLRPYLQTTDITA